MVIPITPNRFISDPAYNPKLAIEQRAQALASTYSGHVSGGRGSPYLAQILERTLGDSYLIVNPLTGEGKSFPGLDINLSESIFTAIYNGNIEPKLQLSILKNQREALRVKEQEDQEQKQRLFRLRYGRPEAPRDHKADLQNFLSKTFPEKYPEVKDSQSKTPLPSFFDDQPLVNHAFDNDGDGAYDFKDLTENDLLAIKTPEQVAISGEVQVADIFADGLPASATHVAVRVSGKQYLDIDLRYPGLDPHIPKIEPSQGTLKLNGNDIADDRFHVFTVSEWAALRYSLPSSPDDEELGPEFLTVVALKDIDQSDDFTNIDERGIVKTVLIRESQDILLSPTTGVNSADRFEALLKNGASISNVDLHIDAGSTDLLALINNGDIEVIVQERGRNAISSPFATLDIAKSSASRLYFNFDRTVSDGINITIYRHGNPVAIQGISLSAYLN